MKLWTRAAIGLAAFALGSAAVAQAQTPEQQLAARKDKRGGPMELLQVIMSLTKRW